MLRTWILASLVHVIVMLGALMVSFGVAMERFDAPGEGGPASWLEAVTSGAAWLLMQPAMAVWEAFPDAGARPDALEWALTLMNSLLWGGVGAWAWRRWRQRHGSARANVGTG